ncbi:hypothetical protein [Thermogymnomonas acidicola]|uniref:hypothetical protein n=1 Tax=Thermogymnomonas acidicola TaxID=399579 RepID=UPI0009461E88|nr:hypothetical protein [Thermogymnomonas acidicola]
MSFKADVTAKLDRIMEMLAKEREEIEGLRGQIQSALSQKQELPDFSHEVEEVREEMARTLVEVRGGMFSEISEKVMSMAQPATQKKAGTKRKKGTNEVEEIQH